MFASSRRLEQVVYMLVALCLPSLVGLAAFSFNRTFSVILFVNNGVLVQWYSTFFVRVPPHIISLQLCTLKVVGA
jgi:hypothetical protein